VVTFLFVLDGRPGVVEFFGVVGLAVITLEGNVFFAIAGVGGGLGFVFNGGVGLVWWSGVGSIGLVITIELLESLVVSVIVNGFEGPDGGGILFGLFNLDGSNKTGNS